MNAGNNFTYEDIEKVHDKYGKADTFLRYVEELKNLGVVLSESYIVDGHSEFKDNNGHAVASPAVHEHLSIANISDRESFLMAVKRHEDGKTTYVEMSKELADSGIEKWVIDTARMTMTYYDLAGLKLLTEKL